MPELPEVEIARQCLQTWASGARVIGVSVHERRVVGAGPPLGSLVGARFVSFERRGKHLCLGLRKGRSDIGLWSHLGMTGKWVCRAGQKEPPQFSRVVLTLPRGARLHYVDLRLFGRLRVVLGAAFDEVPTLAGLGPDVLRDGVDVSRLQARFARSDTPIKVILLDQSVLAGIGNIQASESLFRARLDPRRPARSLTRPELRRLAKGIEASIAFTLGRFADEGVLRGADIRYVEEPAGPNPFRVYGHAGEPCPRRNGTISRIVQAARSTFYCPHCQT